MTINLPELASKFQQFGQAVAGKLADKLGKTEQAVDTAKLAGKTQVDLTASSEESTEGAITDKFITPAGVGDVLDQLTAAIQDMVDTLTNDGGDPPVNNAYSGSMVIGAQPGDGMIGYAAAAGSSFVSGAPFGSLTPNTVNGIEVVVITWSVSGGIASLYLLLAGNQEQYNVPSITINGVTLATSQAIGYLGDPDVTAWLISGDDTGLPANGATTDVSFTLE